MHETLAYTLVRWICWRSFNLQTRLDRCQWVCKTGRAKKEPPAGTAPPPFSHPTETPLLSTALDTCRQGQKSMRTLGGTKGICICCLIAWAGFEARCWTLKSSFTSAIQDVAALLVTGSFRSVHRCVDGTDLGLQEGFLTTIHFQAWV